MDEPLFDAPIPGQGLTHELGGRPWQSPPQYSTVDEAVDYYTSRLSTPEATSQIIDILKMGIPVTSLANTGQGRDIRIIDDGGRLFALGKAVNLPIPILGHQIKISHSGQKIEVPITPFSSTGVIKCVEWAVSIKMLSVFFNHRGAYILIYRGSLFLKNSFE